MADDLDPRLLTLATRLAAFARHHGGELLYREEDGYGSRLRPQGLSDNTACVFAVRIPVGDQWHCSHVWIDNPASARMPTVPTPAADV